MGAVDRLERAIESLFSRLGLFIGHHPISVVLSVFLVTALLSVGLINFKETNNIRTEYSPLNAPSRVEYAVAQNFLGQNGTMDPTFIMVQARDGGSLLRDEYRFKLVNLVKKLQNNVTVMYRGRSYGYKHLCEPYCEMNTAFLAFIRLYDPENQASFTYPAIELFGTQAFIGNNVYGLTLKKGDQGRQYIKAFSTAILPFFLVAPEEFTDLLHAWQKAAAAFFLDEEFASMKVDITGDNMVSEEVRRMGSETAPCLVVSVVTMIVFVVASSFRQNPLKSKPWEALVGCLIPLIALGASTGVISALGIKFQSVVVASLFLVLSVGVDDVFIILRAWDRTDLNTDIPSRLSKTLEESGPSITISSLTNALSFAIGILSTTPAVRTFSIYSCIAIVICYFYQLILFTAVLALSGRRERRGYQALLCCFKAAPQARSCAVAKANDLQVWIIHKWSIIISSWPGRLALLLVMVVYYYFSTTGIKTLHADISIDKMALPDSYLRDFQHTFETALRSMQPITVFVMKPGDLRDPARMKAIKSLVYEFEHSAYAYGNQSTFFWLKQYEDFLKFYGETDDFVYTEIPTFFKSATYFFLTSFVRMNETACFENQPECITAFFFVTNFNEVIKYNEMIPMVVDWRRIASKYSEYEVYPYSQHSPFVDQTMSIRSTILWSVAGALLCTAAACFVFIPNLTSISCAVYSVFSISVGVFGMLSHWGIDLDPLSMAALLMAIGCSVDFTAHISYHYYKATAVDPRERLEQALTSIGWPMVQVGLSTIVAILPLLIKQSYLAMVFVKTIVVVVLLGLGHGLVVLPAILTAVMVQPVDKQKDSANSSTASSRSGTERKDSFYKTQNLIKASKQKGSKLSPLSGGAKKKAKEAHTVAPVSAIDVVANGPIAFVHRIELGRAGSAMDISK